MIIHSSQIVISAIKKHTEGCGIEGKMGASFLRFGLSLWGSGTSMIEITHVGACAYVLIPNKHSGQPAWVVFPGRQHFTHVTISCWSN